MRSGEARRSAWELSAGGTELIVPLFDLDRQYEQGAFGRGMHVRQHRQRRGAGALCVRASWIQLRVRVVAGVMTRVTVIAMLVRHGRRIGVAQYDLQGAVDRRKHETCRNEGPQAQHCQKQRCGPTPYAIPLLPIRSLFHATSTMPQTVAAINCAAAVPRFPHRSRPDRRWPTSPDGHHRAQAA